MDSDGRKKFWDVLNSLHDNSETSVKTLMDASPWPKTLCRFRSVNKASLQQLNDNKLFFSSADYYDDPFDTYFYIDVEQMIPEYEQMRENLFVGRGKNINAVNQLAIVTRQNPDVLIREILNKPVDFTMVKEQLIKVRDSMQKKMFSVCFCEDEYNETLWLKYAGNYSGFVQVYDLENPDTFMCGKSKECLNCITAKDPLYFYPVYYSDKRYDATKFAWGTWLIDNFPKNSGTIPTAIYQYVQENLMWEVERISLIKKKCHENDQEWRMIRPAIFEQRTCVKMKPCKVIIGLRTPEYESRLIVSAALNAGIQEIHKLYINDSDELDSKPVQEELYHL